MNYYRVFAIAITTVVRKMKLFDKGNYVPRQYYDAKGT